MNVLIIGGSGHVSGAVARVMVENGHTVWAVTRGQRALPAGVRPLVADRCDEAALEVVISGAHVTWDLVVDCICYRPADLRHDLHLFRERAAQFVFISTDFVYDPARRRFPQSEESACYVANGDGSLSYGYQKRQCELELLEGDTGKLAWTVVRPCHIYGPTSELGCLPRHGRDPQLIDRLRAGEALQLVGGGHFLQQPILADDLARTIHSIAGNTRTHGQCYNTAGPDIVESRQYYQYIADALGVELTIEEVSVQAALLADPGLAPFLCHRIYDLRRLAEHGLHVPATPLKEGLRQHVEGLLARR